MKRFQFISLFILCLCMFIPSVQANNQYRITLEVDKSEVQVNDTLKVKVNLEEVNVEKGFNSYTIALAYDEDALDLLTVEDSDNWEAPEIDGNYLIGTSKGNKLITTDGRITVFNFKVKNKLGTSLIRVGAFSVSDGTTEIKTSNYPSVKISIQTTTTTTTTTKKTTTSTSKKTTTKKTTTTTTTTTEPTTTTQEPTTISTTSTTTTSKVVEDAILKGEKKRSFFWITIVVLFLATLVVYFGYEKREK